MNLRAILRTAAAAIAGLCLGYVALNHGATVAATSAGAAESAINFDPDSAYALSRQAEVDYAAGRHRPAAELARRAIAAAPYEVRAVRTLGLSMLALGQVEGGQVMLRAGALGWRDTATQEWLIQQAALQNDFGTLVERVDGLMRRERNGDRMLALLHRIAIFPQGRQAIVARLADGAPWQERFFTMLNQLRPEEFDAHAQVLADYKSAGGEVGREQAAPFANRLVANGRFAEARSLWLATAKPGGQAAAAPINDPEFGAVQASGDDVPVYPFEWRLRDGGGAFAAVGSPPMLVGESALQARSEGGDEAVIAEQTLLLSPGARRLGYDVVAEPPAADRGFAWAMRCLPGNQLLRPEAGSAAAVGIWRRTNVTFRIPATGCAAQKLELRALDVDGDEPLEAWFDNVRYIG